MAAFGVAAHAPVSINHEGELTFETAMGHQWRGAVQFHRRADAMAFVRLCERQGFRTEGHALHVVELGDA